MMAVRLIESKSRTKFYLRQGALVSIGAYYLRTTKLATHLDLKTSHLTIGFESFAAAEYMLTIHHALLAHAVAQKCTKDG